MDGFFEVGLLRLEGTSIGARVSRPLMDEVMFTEDQQSGTAVLDSPRIEPSVMMKKSADGYGGKGLKGSVSLLVW